MSNAAEQRAQAIVDTIEVFVLQIIGDELNSDVAYAVAKAETAKALTSKITLALECAGPESE